MQAFNVAVGVSNIVSCVTGVCTLGVYRKNEPCKINIHLNASEDHLLIAFKDLADYAQDLSFDEYQELERDCNKLDDTLRTKAAAAKVAKLNYFVRRKKYGQLLEDAQTLEEETRDVIKKIRGKSAAARAQEAERKRMAQHEGPNNKRDLNQRNPFCDEGTTAWQGHKHSA